MVVELGQVRLKEELIGYDLLPILMRVTIFRMRIDKDIKGHSQSRLQDQFMMMYLDSQIEEHVYGLGKVGNKKDNK